MRVDFPAPLSPTSAITSPSRTSKSTPRSACTEPKLLWTPRSSSVAIAGVVAMGAVCITAGTPREGAPAVERLLAVLRVRPAADVALLQEPVVEELLVVRLRDPHGRQQNRLGAGDGAVHAGHGLALHDRDRGL